MFFLYFSFYFYFFFSFFPIFSFHFFLLYSSSFFLFLFPFSFPFVFYLSFSFLFLRHFLIFIAGLLRITDAEGDIAVPGGGVDPCPEYQQYQPRKHSHLRSG